MQAVVPIERLNRRTEPQPSTMKINYNNMCQSCASRTKDLRQLPCQHKFCKPCLKAHIDSYDDLRSAFHCKVCRQSVTIPEGISKEELIQTFKTSSKSVFYDNEGDSMLRSVSFNDASSFTNSNGVLRRNTKEVEKIGRSTRRTALHISKSLLGQIQGFTIQTNDDSSSNICWGVDCFPNGDIVIADWNNSCLKLHSKDGIFMSKLKVSTIFTSLFLLIHSLRT